MKKLLTAIFAISVTVPAFADVTVTGTVLDADNEPAIGASITRTDTKRGVPADRDGKFSIVVPNDDTKLTFSYVGTKTKTLTAAQANGQNIIMEPDTEVLGNLEVNGCTKNSVANAKSILYNKATEKCVPTECESARYKLTGQTTATKINQNSCTTDSADQCENDDTSCTTITIGDACVDQAGMDCIDQAGDHVRTAKYEWDGNKLNCVIKKCDDHFMLDNGVCTASDGPCSDAQIAEIEHAKSGELKRGKCHVTECDPGYEASNNTCVAVGGDCKSLPDDAISGTRKWDAEQNKEICIVTACRDGYSISTDKLSCKTKLSKEDSQARVDELRENAKKMHDKENSWANRLIGAAGIGATGVGTSQALSALAEQRADQNAEDDMRAYLATFKCDYGMGKNINGGDMGIELPGGNELTQYVTQYKTLAADLKVRKDALGMSPGIESETIIDAADTGLYDNAATGKTDGAFTSLSRALSDETSADAAAWAKQKADTASKLKTGATVAGIGAVGSAIANLAVNSGDAKKNKSDEIMKKYASKYTQELQRAIDDVARTISQKKCSDFPGATGTYPNCTCSDNTQYFSAEQGCVACDGGHIVNATKNGCECPSDKPVEQGGQCIAKTPACNLTGLKKADACQCIDNAASDNTQTCKCNDGYTERDGTCVQNQTTLPQLETAITLDISSDTYFDSGRATVKNADSLKTELQQKINNQQGLDWTNLTYCVLVTGHTDRTKFRTGSSMNNQKLSQQRADAVTGILKQVFTQGAPSFESTGKADTECDTTRHPQPNDQTCRHVKVTITAGTCDGTGTNAGSIQNTAQQLLNNAGITATQQTSDQNITAATNVAAVAVTNSSDLKTKITSQERNQTLIANGIESKYYPTDLTATEESQLAAMFELCKSENGYLKLSQATRGYYAVTQTERKKIRFYARCFQPDFYVTDDNDCAETVSPGNYHGVITAAAQSKYPYVNRGCTSYGATRASWYYWEADFISNT